MKVMLPIKTKDELIDSKRVVEYAEKSFELDMSLNAQMRWESKFATQAEREDLVSYTQRIKADVDKSNLSAATVISMFKTIYCYFDTEMTFTQFLKLFDLSSVEYTEKLVNKLKEVFEIVLDGAAEKN